MAGNITFMDRLERLAFNALPAALWPNVTANVYHHCSNQLAAPSAPYSYGLYYCCSANVHQGWPKFVMSAVQLSSSTGQVVVSSYAPSISTLPDDKGTVHIAGSYPFSDNATISVTKPTNLTLRVPCWVDGATVIASSGGKPLGGKPCSFLALAEASPGTSYTIVFHQRIRTYKWAKSAEDGQRAILGGGMEVHRGPLTFALRPANTVNATSIKAAPLGFQDYAVAATGDWNYALLESSLKFESSGPVPAGVPFSDTAPPPVRVKAQARKVPEWKFHGGARGVAPVPKSPLESSEPLVDVELVPFGSTNVRISVFPQLIK